jgi:hypothetical protein
MSKKVSKHGRKAQTRFVVNGLVTSLEEHKQAKRQENAVKKEEDKGVIAGLNVIIRFREYVWFLLHDFKGVVLSVW